jgi:hypothetical protein
MADVRAGVDVVDRSGEVKLFGIRHAQKFVELLFPS